MDMAVVFARFWGIFSVAFFSALLLNKKLYDILLEEKERQGFMLHKAILQKEEIPSADNQHWIKNGWLKG